MRHGYRYGLVLLYGAAIFAVSGVSQIAIVAAIWGVDKVGHFLAFYLLCYVLAWAILGKRVSSKSVFVIACLAAGYGVTDEIHQSFVPGRSCSPGDLMADAAGAAAWGGSNWFTRKGRREAATPQR